MNTDDTFYIDAVTVSILSILVATKPPVMPLLIVKLAVPTRCKTFLEILGAIWFLIIISPGPNRVKHGRCLQQQTVNMFAWIFFSCKGVQRRMRGMSRVAL